MQNSVGLETTLLLPTQRLLGVLGSWPHSRSSASCAALLRSSTRGERQPAFFQAMHSPQLCKQPLLGLTAVCSPLDSPRAGQMAEILPPLQDGSVGEPRLGCPRLWREVSAKLAFFYMVRSGMRTEAPAPELNHSVPPVLNLFSSIVLFYLFFLSQEKCRGNIVEQIVC